MFPYNAGFFSSSTRRGVFLLSLLAFLIFLPAAILAQSTNKVTNGLIAINAVTGQKSGRFWFSSGDTTGDVRFLYHQARTAETITSNIVFKISRNGQQDLYYCNTPNNFFSTRPQTPGGEATYIQYDEMYISPNADTMEIRWKGVNVFDVVLRFVPEKAQTIYDNGADMIMEIEWKRDPFSSPATMGVFLMLDGDNGQAGGTGGGDRSSIMTDVVYLPSRAFGKKFATFSPNAPEIPEYYQIGNFEYEEPLNVVLPVHRLKGTSQGGLPLTPPELVAFGSWRDFRSLSWDINGDIDSKQMNDVAIAMRWTDLTAPNGFIRTAFGTTNRTGNDMFHCRDSAVFANIRTERVVRQQGINGPYVPAQFDVVMWIANLNEARIITPQIRLNTPITSFPNGTRRLTLDASTPSVRTLEIGEAKVQKLTWRVNLNGVSTDTLAEITFDYKDSTTQKQWRPFLDGCSPLVSFISAYIPPPPDSRPPAIDRTGSGRNTTAYWDFRTYDRHTGYQYDSGLDTIEVIRNTNFTFALSPNPFKQCDITTTVDIRASVIDTTRGGCIVFCVYDCEGNVKCDSVCYNPRPDIFQPEVTRRDSAGADAGYPCNARVFEVTVEDRKNQTQNAGDNGLGIIEVLSSTNFNTIQINYDRGEIAIADFDPVATFRLEVEDTLQGASAVVRIADYAGNADTLYFGYCTIEDTKPPVIFTITTPDDPIRRWMVDAGDIRPWDRGLAEVVEISRTNMTVTPWPVPITPGQESVTGIQVDVTDDAWDGAVTLEFRDTYYDANNPATYADHSAQATLTFAGIKDTIPPDIAFAADISTPGTVVYDVEVQDIHTVNGMPYNYDRGLQDVQVTLTPNMQQVGAIAYNPNRRTAALKVRVVDLLAVDRTDTVCVTAIDSAGNSSQSCITWPSVPDDKAPILVAAMNAARTSIDGTLTDNRENDRGLSSLSVENPVNLDVMNLTTGGLNGAATTNFSLGVLNPAAPVSGTLVLRDLYGELTGAGEQDIHTVKIPFSLPVIDLGVRLPSLVEGNEEFNVDVIANRVFAGGEAGTMEFEVLYNGNGTFVRGTTVTAQSFTATAIGGSTIRVQCQGAPGTQYQPGDVLGRITFYANREYQVSRFTLQGVAGSERVNNGQGMVITVNKPASDPLASTLTLPPPLFRVAIDPEMFVNGECGRFLTDGRGAGRLTGIAILSVKPQPAPVSGGQQIEMLVRDIPQEGAIAELLDAAGQVVATYRTGQPTSHVSDIQVALPKSITPGLYFFRLQGSTGSDWTKIVVVQ